MSTVTKPILKDETFAAKMDALLAALTHTYYTLTVTALTKDDVTVTGQIVTVREGGRGGVVYATEAYNGQPVSFSLPEGFHYFVEISNTLNHHFGPTYSEGIIAGANKSVILYYSDLSHITTATDIQEALNAGEDLSGLLGETITCSKGNDTLTWDIVNVFSDEVTLLLSNSYANNVYCNGQALAWFETGLSAGSYKFKNGNTYYYLTLTSSIPAGGQLQASSTGFTTYESPYSVNVVEQGSVTTTEISGATDLGVCGTDTGLYVLNYLERVTKGSNNLAEGPINYWLNHDVASGEPVPSASKFGRPFTFNVDGFTKDLDPDFLAVIADTEWKCASNKTYETPISMGGVCNVNSSYTYTAKFSLPSRKEIFGTNAGDIEANDYTLQLYIGSTANDRKKYNKTGSAIRWWLRSPTNQFNMTYTVDINGSSAGQYDSVCCERNNSFVPICKIKKTV